MGLLRSLGSIVFGKSNDDSHDSNYHNCECYSFCDGNCYSCHNRDEYENDDYDYNDRYDDDY